MNTQNEIKIIEQQITDLKEKEKQIADNNETI